MNARFFLTLFISILTYLTPSFAEENYDFVGHHLLASYMECDQEALSDLEALESVMEQAVHASGATILSSSKYVFPGNGLTMVFLLSESHASIHTYPEHKACFIDLFTCGDSCDAKKFDNTLRAYLKPAEINSKLLQRDSSPE